MIYFIGGLQNREFKYFDIIKKIREENAGITENFFDADIKEEEKFLEKISFNSIFSAEELVVLKRSEKLKDLEKILDYITALDLNKKEIIIEQDGFDQSYYPSLDYEMHFRLIQKEKSFIILGSPLTLYRILENVGYFLFLPDDRAEKNLLDMTSVS